MHNSAADIIQLVIAWPVWVCGRLHRQKQPMGCVTQPAAGGNSQGECSQVQLSQGISGEMSVGDCPGGNVRGKVNTQTHAYRWTAFDQLYY